MPCNGARGSSGVRVVTLLLLAASVRGDSKWVWGGNARLVNENSRLERLRDREVVESPLTQPLFKPAPDYQPDKPNYRPPGRYDQGIRNDYGPQTFNRPTRPRPIQATTRPPYRFEQPDSQRPQSDPFPRPGGFGRPGAFQPGPGDGGGGGGGYPRPPLGGLGPVNGGDFPERPYGGGPFPGGPGFRPGGFPGGPGGLGPGGPGGLGPLGPGGLGPTGPGGLGPGGPGGFGNGIGGPRPGDGPDVLTGPVPSWEQRPGPRPFHGYDTCKCAHAFNCISPGIQFGHCDVGKTYCCHNSIHVGGVNREGPIGPGGPGGSLRPGRPVLSGPGGPIDGPSGPGGPLRPGRPVLSGPGGPVDGPLGPGGPHGGRPVLSGPGGPHGGRPILSGPGGPHGGRPILSGPGGPIDGPGRPGLIGPGGPDPYGGRPVLVGPGGPTGVIGPNGPRPPLPFGDRFNGDGNGIYPVNSYAPPLLHGRSSDPKTPAKIKK